MLRKKTNGVARRPQRTSILSQVGEKTVDRRAFLRGSGLTIGGLAAISATGGTVTPASAQTAANQAVEQWNAFVANANAQPTTSSPSAPGRDGAAGSE